MYEVKNRIFLEFTKTQKSALCNYLRALVKKCSSRSSAVSACEEQDQLNDGDVRGFEEISTGAKLPDLSVDEVLEKFLEDEKYYLEINSSRFEFLEDFIEDERFIFDARLYIKECKKYYDYKKTQEPLIQAQKEFDKKKRKFLQEVKMSKDVPTVKQLYYYKNLCKRYNIEKNIENENGEALSKLDLRNEIDRILSEHKAD